jgi:PDZ domain
LQSRSSFGEGKWFLSVEHIADPVSGDVADRGDAKADDEHVEAGSEDASAGEDGTHGADEEVASHRDDERRDDRGMASEKEEGDGGDEGADRGRHAEIWRSGKPFSTLRASKGRRKERRCASSMGRCEAVAPLKRHIVSPFPYPFFRVRIQLMRFYIPIAAVFVAAPALVHAQIMNINMGSGSAILSANTPGVPLQTDLSLGMSLTSTGTKRDTLGVFVESVAAGGPAEQAGIVEGDRIVAIDALDLHMAAFMSEDAAFKAGVITHLRQTMQGLKSGTPVHVRVYSGGHVKTVLVMPDKWATVYPNNDARDKTNSLIATF